MSAVAASRGRKTSSAIRLERFARSSDDSRSERCLECGFQRPQARRYISAEMNAHRTAIAVDENLEISPRLSRFHHPERVFLPGHGQIRAIVARHLDEDPRVRPAFVSLAGRVEEPRPEFQARGDTLRIAHRMPDGLE